MITERCIRFNLIDPSPRSYSDRNDSLIWTLNNVALARHGKTRNTNALVGSVRLDCEKQRSDVVTAKRTRPQPHTPHNLNLSKTDRHF